ncbi:hypothetical protein [Nocardia seriolae]|uniref:hypothetical protein n=1 Tax=Nocardia seriolae TaxID=37332 RepID=UPI0008FF0D93|nr:hypothetical protein [Nocardia seriolae]OJF82066.1 hypothetical protein NS14008_26480 [Nocardia seriolae]PSK27718.1 hypothetical protein C6575_30425 [Nocardia seriolae]QOW33847.1 hypothetical protein IMZ23_01360 [Nocardia seriolae]QUN14972.1 hypothetical protein KEC46_21320 [Nocardia seriolae]WNJ61045.1 hypothetical protein RMO66_10260 [Nocardia seriolae]
MASDAESDGPGEGVLQRGFGRALMVFGGLFLLIGSYQPLLSFDRIGGGREYSFIDLRDFGTLPMGPRIAGAVLLILLPGLLGERFQTSEAIAGVLVVTCAQAFATVLWVAIGFTLMSSAESESKRVYEISGVDLKFGLYLLILGLALAVAGAIWWCVNVRRREG